jgi:hypothetical protein
MASPSERRPLTRLSSPNNCASLKCMRDRAGQLSPEHALTQSDESLDELELPLKSCARKQAAKRRLARVQAMWRNRWSQSSSRMVPNPSRSRRGQTSIARIAPGSPSETARWPGAWCRGREVWLMPMCSGIRRKTTTMRLLGHDEGGKLLQSYLSARPHHWRNTDNGKWF